MRRAFSMLGCVVALWGAIVAQAWSAEGNATEPPAAGRLTAGGGAIAVRSGPGEKWRLVREGDALPVAFEFLCGGQGARIECNAVRLDLFAAARGSVAESGTRVTLADGSVTVLAAAEKPVAVAGGGVGFQVAGGSLATFDLAPETGEIVCQVGEVVLDPDTPKPQRVAGPSTTTFTPGKKDYQIAKGPPARPDAISEPLVLVAKDENAPFQGLGQLVVNNSPNGGMRRLHVARYHVNVVLQPPVALVQIDQSFYNPYNRQEEGTYVFNLPRGASVSRFAMYVTRDQLIEGELIDRRRAQEVYTSIVTARRDPAILEQIGDDLFKMRVFPIFANDTKRVLLDFTLPLDEIDGRTAFRLPLASDVKPIWDFRITGSIRCAGGVKDVASPTHPGMAFRPHGDACDLLLEQRNYAPAKDLAIDFTAAKPPQTEVRTYRAEPLSAAAGQASADGSPAQDYFLASLRPSEELTRRASVPADILILADTTTGTAQVGRLLPHLATVLDSLRPEDRFQLMAIDAAARNLSGGWTAPGTDSARKAVESLADELCLGAFRPKESFAEALAAFDGRPADRRRLVIFLSGGESLDRQTTPAIEREAVAKSLAGAKAALAVLSAPPREATRKESLLAPLACGLSFDARHETHGAGPWSHWLAAGMPSPVRIVSVACEGAKVDDLYYMQNLPPGRALRILGRTAAKRQAIRIEAAVECGGLEAKIAGEGTIGEEGGDVFLGRLWAQRKLEELLAEEKKPAGNSVSNWLRLQITRLSREWSLLSPYTAFLVLESEADYGRWGIVRSERRRYWKPAEALATEPLPAKWIQQLQDPTATDGENWILAELADLRKRAKAAVEAENYALANAVLNSPNNLQRTRWRWEQTLRLQQTLAKRAAADPELAALREKTRQGLAKQVRHGGAKGSAADPLRLFTAADAQADPLALFSLSAQSNAESDRRHPHLAKLARPVDLAKQTNATVGDLVDLLRDATGANVLCDRRALDELGINMDTPCSVAGTGTISLGSYARAALKQVDLVMVDMSDRLRITTQEANNADPTVEIYPVGDLLLAGHKTPLGLLLDPIADRELAAEARIKKQLQKPISVEMIETPLGVAMDRVAKLLDVPLAIDGKALDGLGINKDTPLTANWRNVPGAESLRLLLRDLDATYTIHHEAVFITTQEAVNAEPTTRLYSLRGIALLAPTELQNLPWGMGAGGSRRGGRPMFMGGLGGAGMGMGGMGGGMGGMGGAVAPPPSVPAPPPTPQTPAAPDASVSEAPPADAATQTTQVPLAGGESDRGPSAGMGGLSAVPPPPRSSQVDFDSTIDMITSTVAPTTWDAVGGPGSIAPFPYTLDLVVSQTEAVHAQIKDLLGRIRRLPVAPQQAGVRLAELPDAAPRPGEAADFDSLIDLITSTVAPTTWDAVGGPGSIVPEESRCALVVSQTPEVQDQLTQLLTMLRRSRYEAEHQQRPWLNAGRTATVLAPALAAQIEAMKRAQPTAEPTPAELALLAVRRPMGDATLNYRRTRIDAGATDSLLVLKTRNKLVLQCADAAFTADENAAEAAYHDLRLKQSGPWAEAVRRLADAWLPWRPHRGNEELARALAVSKLADDAENVRLKLVPRALPADGGAWIEAAFSRRTGQPTAWDYYEAGKLAARLRFAAKDGTETVTLEDAKGKALVRWEAGSVDVKPRGSDGYLVVGPGGDADFSAAVAAMGTGDWRAADAALVKTIAAHPEHPLLPFLRAACLDYEPNTDTAAALIGPMRKAIAVEPALGRLLSAQAICWPTAAQRLEILLAVPEASRGGEHWRQLARAAVAAGRLDDAVLFVRKAPTPELEVEILLKAGRGDEALKLVSDAPERHARTADEWLSLGHLAASHGAKKAAFAFYQRGIDTGDLPPNRLRSAFAAQAGVCEGLERCRVLLRAMLAEVVGPIVPPELNLEAYANALNDPQIYATLAEETDNPGTKAWLLLRQAALTSDTRAAGDLAWQAWETDKAGSSLDVWTLEQWNSNGQYERTIRAVESRVRAGYHLPASWYPPLAAAYAKEGRQNDALRARTVDN